MKSLKERESCLFQLSTKDSSQIMTKEGSNGYPSLLEIPSKCVALYKGKDDDTPIVQTIRYVAGEVDLRVSKQRKDITPKMAPPIQFVDGSLLVTRFEPLLLEYIEHCDFYEGNPNRNPNVRQDFMFKLVDKDAIKLADLKKEEVKIEAEALVLEMFKSAPERATMFCEAVGVNTDQVAELMKHDLLVRVRKNPSLFLEQLKDPNTKQKAVVKNALKSGIIKVSGNTVLWSDGSSTGFTMPIGSTNVESEFIAWMDEPKGKKVYENIKFKVNNPIEQL